MEISQRQPLNIKKLKSKTRRVVKSQPGLFLALSILFLLPLSAAIFLYPALLKFSANFKKFQNHALPSKLSSFLPLGLFLFSIFSSPCFTGSITYADFHGLIGEPVNLKSALKSFPASFFPLLTTFLVEQAIVFLCTLLFHAFPGILMFGLSQTIYSSLCSMVTFFSALFIVYLLVNWSLTYVIVMVESRRGFEALSQSKALIQGKRSLALFLSLILGSYYLLFFRNSYVMNLSFGDFVDGAIGTSTYDEWWYLLLVLGMEFLFNVAFLTLILLYLTVAKTAVYVYCTARDCGHEDFRGEYLPVSDEKVAYLIAFVFNEETIK